MKLPKTLEECIGNRKLCDLLGCTLSFFHCIGTTGNKMKCSSSICNHDCCQTCKYANNPCDVSGIILRLRKRNPTLEDIKQAIIIHKLKGH